MRGKKETKQQKKKYIYIYIYIYMRERERERLEQNKLGRRQPRKKNVKCQDVALESCHMLATTPIDVERHLKMTEQTHVSV